MTVEFRITDINYGEVNIFAIRTYEDGTWEKEWEPLRLYGPPEIVDLLSKIPWVTWTELLHRHARPFFKDAGLGPKGCLMKIPVGVGICHYRSTCPSFDTKVCHANAKTLPPCYDASVEEAVSRALISRLIDWWRNDFYVVLVMPESAL